jgi:hypothetical protein
MKKMKAGTLVRLSSYGKDRDYNWSLQRIVGKGQVQEIEPIGIIIQAWRYGVDGYKVRWINTQVPNKEERHHRRELKYVKR